MKLLRIALPLFAMVVLSRVAFAEPTAEVQIELPEPLFQGTPPHIKSKNLDKRSLKPRKPFLAPQGVTVISRGADVTASDDLPILGELEMITDGDKEGSEGSYVEFGPGVQWVQIDLGENKEIHAVVLWHYHQQGRVYHDVIVEIADDEDFIANVRTLYNNDHDNSAGKGVGKDLEYIESHQGRLIAGNGEKARYIRCHSNGNTSGSMNHMIEVEVYGK